MKIRREIRNDKDLNEANINKIKENEKKK